LCALSRPQVREEKLEPFDMIKIDVQAGPPQFRGARSAIHPLQCAMYAPGFQHARSGPFAALLRGGADGVRCAAQGAEVMALKGAPHALEGVEVILTEVRQAPSWPTPAFRSCTPAGMCGPTRVVWADLTPSSHETSNVEYNKGAPQTLAVLRY
jgi:hypothetical protein